MLVFFALVLSLLGLAAGPLLVAIGTRRLGLGDAVDGLTLGVVPALVASRLLPHLYGEIGVAAWILALAGYAALGRLERRPADRAAFGAGLVLPALAFHSAVDGAALALAFDNPANVGAVVLGGALVLHRLPEGLLIGSVLIPRVGVRRTLKGMSWLAVGTLAGAIAGRAFLLRAPAAWLDGIVAIGLGIMVHLVVHRHTSHEGVERPDAPDRPDDSDRRDPSLWAFGVGVAAALAVPGPGDTGSRVKFAFAGLAAALLAARGRLRRPRMPLPALRTRARERS